MLDAREHGARILTGMKSPGLSARRYRVRRAVFDPQYNEYSELYARGGQCGGDLGAAHCRIRRLIHPHVPGRC
jgi:hypothetical protein